MGSLSEKQPGRSCVLADTSIVPCFEGADTAKIVVAEMAILGDVKCGEMLPETLPNIHLVPFLIATADRAAFKNHLCKIVDDMYDSWEDE